jgi:hypothetical protein
MCTCQSLFILSQKDLPYSIIAGPVAGFASEHIAVILLHSTSCICTHLGSSNVCCLKTSFTLLFDATDDHNLFLRFLILYTVDDLMLCEAIISPWLSPLSSSEAISSFWWILKLCCLLYHVYSSLVLLKLIKVQVTQDKLVESLCAPEVTDGRTSVLGLPSSSAKLQGLLD